MAPCAWQATSPSKCTAHCRETTRMHRFRAVAHTLAALRSLQHLLKMQQSIHTTDISEPYAAPGEIGAEIPQKTVCCSQ
eukprot:5687437-Karenia_brevis.AAC.1